MRNLEDRLDKLLDEVEGQSQVAIEAPSGWGYRRNADKMVSAASTIKLLLLAEVYGHNGCGELDLDQHLDVTGAAGLTAGSGVLSRLHYVDELSVYDLAVLMIIVSDNAATNVLLENVGFGALDRLARDLGLSNTRFRRRMMDSEAAKRGEDNVTSAADMVVLLRFIRNFRRSGFADEGKPVDQVEEADPAPMIDILCNQQLNSKLSGRLPFEYVDSAYAHKTGELPGIEHDVGILETANGPVYVALMLTELPDNHAGKSVISEIGRLLSEAFRAEGSERGSTAVQSRIGWS